MASLQKIRWPVVSWILYDFANTMFSMNVVSLHFALWLTRDQKGKDLYYSLIHCASVLAVMMIAPWFGRKADERGKPRFYLMVSTLMCVTATALIGSLNRLDAGLILFFVASSTYQIALVFYDSLLPSVASEKEYGSISGVGVAVGYLGAIAAIYLVNPWIESGGQLHHARAFVPTAFYFLLFSIPCFFLVPERKAQNLQTTSTLHLGNLKSLRSQKPTVFFYLVSMFLIQNAVNTVILFMSVYASEVGGFDQRQLSLFLSISTLTAVLTSFGFGKLVDRIGALPVFQSTIAIWILGLLLLFLGNYSAVLWVAGSFIGTGLGGLWTSSRPLLLSLIPKEESGSYFGMNVLAGRFSALIGPLLWGIIVWALEPLGVLRYRIAVASLVFFVLFSGFFSFKIKKA